MYSTQPWNWDITGPQQWRKSHMNWQEVLISLSCMAPHCIYILPFIFSHHPYWWVSTIHGDDTILSASPGVWPIHKTSSNAWWTRYLTTVMVWLELHMILSSMARMMMKNMTDASANLWKRLMNMALCSVMENVLSTTICELLQMCHDKDGTHPNPAKVSAVHNMPPLETNSSRNSLVWSHSYLHLCHLFQNHWSSIGTAQKRQRVHIEWIMPESFWHQEIFGLYRNYPKVLWSP